MAIRIVNNDGTTVYVGAKSYTKENFTSNFVLRIYIDCNDILPDTKARGDLYFSITGKNHSSPEYENNVYDLPIKPVIFETPIFPLTISSYFHYDNPENLVASFIINSAEFTKIRNNIE